VNIRVKHRKPLEDLPGVVAQIEACETALNGLGRVVVRFSGTEPLARVMVEAEDMEQVEAWAGRIAHAIRAELA
jgi:phosphoglucosamine mutase